MDEGKKKLETWPEMSEVEEGEFCVSLYVCVFFFIYFAYVPGKREAGEFERLLLINLS